MSRFINKEEINHKKLDRINGNEKIRPDEIIT